MTVRALCLAAVAALIGAAPAAAEVHVTSSADSGAGSLRATIAAVARGETIVIDPGVNPVLSSEIAIDRSLTLRGQGAGATRIGIGPVQTRVFKVGEATPSISVAIEALEIAGGMAPTGAPGGFSGVSAGGPGASGGAILNKANRLRLVGVALTGNRAGFGGPGEFGGSSFGGEGGAGGDGGAIWNSGGMTIVDSTLSGNKAGGGGMGGFGSVIPGSPGLGGDGGAISNSGALTVVDSTFAQNEAGAGTAAIPSSIPPPGSGGGGGGAIDSVGTLTISGSTLVRNTAGAGGTGGSAATIGGSGGSGGSGGAIRAAGTVDVTNSTFAGNVAGGGGAGGSGTSLAGRGGNGGEGGAIAVIGGTTRLAAVTVSGNAAGAGGAAGGPTGTVGASGSAGGIVGAATVRASIVAANDGGAEANCKGGVVDGGGNLAFPEASGCMGFAVADPLFDPVGLAANGGPTQTIALLPGSAAIGLVPAAACLTAAGEALTVDQRGVARPAGACDAGAYEVNRAPPAPPQQSRSGSSAPSVAPDTKLTKRPKARVVTHRKRARVTVGFNSDQAGAGFECSLDKGRFVTCKSPQVYKLKQGRHTIAVRAVLGGAVDPTPATVSFKVVKAKKKRPKHRR